MPIVIDGPPPQSPVGPAVVRIGPDRTLVRLVMAYEPQGATENVGDALGLLSTRVEKSVKQFKKYIESRGVEDGAWRGEVRDSKPQPKRPH